MSLYWIIYTNVCNLRTWYCQHLCLTLCCTLGWLKAMPSPSTCTAMSAMQAQKKGVAIHINNERCQVQAQVGAVNC